MEIIATKKYTMGYNKSVDKKGIEIVFMYLNESTDKIVVPETINGLPVVTIKTCAFEDDMFVQGEKDFICQELILPSTISTLEEGAFKWVPVRKIFIPKSITKIPDSCFLESCVNEIVFEDLSEITEIEEFAFHSSEITNFVWPPKCKCISEHCFSCTPLEKISGIEHVTDIEEGAFQGTQCLKSFTWPTGCKYISDSCFSESGISSISDISDVREIRPHAFAFTDNLEKFNWPSKCDVIPSGCFFQSGITEVSNIDHIKSIGEMAFYQTKELRQIKWPKACQEISESCFEGSAIKDISDLENVKTVGKKAFSDCLCLNKLRFGPVLESVYESSIECRNNKKLSIDVSACSELKVLKERDNDMYPMNEDPLTLLIERLDSSFEFDITVVPEQSNTV